MNIWLGLIVMVATGTSFVAVAFFVHLIYYEIHFFLHLPRQMRNGSLPLATTVAVPNIYITGILGQFQAGAVGKRVNSVRPAFL